MPARKIRVGAWELQHHILRPTRCLLQTHTERLQNAITPPQDPLITFHLTSHPPTPHSPPKDDAPRSVAIHRCLLRAAGGPLEALVTAPFQEANQSDIVIHETFESFDIIRRFLYCQPIKMLHLPPDLPLVADRWGLTTLFEACFTHAEERAHAHAQIPKLSMPEMVMTYLPIMAIVDVPERFKTYFAVRLAVEMRSVDKHFRQQPVQPTSIDHICCVQHDQSVTCRRRRAVCAGKDQQPCTTIDNSSATSASVKHLGEPGEETAEVFGDAENTVPSTEENTEENTRENPEEKAESDSGNDSREKATEEAAEEAAEEIAPDASTSEKGGEGDTDEVAVTPDREPPNGDVERDGPEETAEAASDGIVASDAREEPVGDDVEAAVSGEEQAQAKEAETDMNGEIASNPDDADTGEGEQEQAPPVTLAAGEEGNASESNGPGATSNTAEGEQPDDAENEAQSDGEGSNLDGSISDVSEPENTDVSRNETADSEKAESDGPDSDVWSIEDPTTSEAPLHEEWHDHFNIWEVFHNRRMLEQVVHYLSLVGGSSCTPLILDIALRQLEEKLSDEELIKLLSQVDWEWENPESGSLTSHAADSWSSRGWRLLARAKFGFLRNGRDGDDIRMRWNYDDLCRDMYARSNELANRSNNGSDSDSSHSSDDDDTEFVADWCSNGSGGNLSFTMSVQCDRMTLDGPTPLNLRLRVLEQEDSYIDKRNGAREVAVQIRYIESGCGCDLSGSKDQKSRGQVITSAVTSNMENNTTLWQFKDSGMNYKIMNGHDLQDWIARHKQECGLVFHVRLFVYPLKEDESKKKSNSDEDEDNYECTCGFCECEPCRLEAQQGDQQSEQGGVNQDGDENN